MKITHEEAEAMIERVEKEYRKNLRETHWDRWCANIIEFSCAGSFIWIFVMFASALYVESHLHWAWFACAWICFPILALGFGARSFVAGIILLSLNALWSVIALWDMDLLHVLFWGAAPLCSLFMTFVFCQEVVKRMK